MQPRSRLRLIRREFRSLVSLNCALSSQPRRFLQQPRSLRCVSSLRINAPSIFDNSGHSGLRAFYRKSCLPSVITSIGTRRLVLLSKHFKSRGLLEVTVRGRLPGRCQCLWTGYPRCSRGSSGSSFSVFHAESGPRTWNTYRPLRVGILWPHLLCPVCSRSPGSEFIVPQVHSERRRPANCSLQTWGQLWIGPRKGHRLSFLRRDSSAIFFLVFFQDPTALPRPFLARYAQFKPFNRRVSRRCELKLVIDRFGSCLHDSPRNCLRQGRPCAS